MPSSVIETPRLVLSFPFMHEGMDVSHYLRWLNDSAITKYSEQRHTVHTVASQYEYLSSFSASDRYFWDINLNGTPIGTITAFLDLHNATANMGILLGERRYHGQGFATEAWQAVSNFLFERGTRKLEGGCMAANQGMIRVFEHSDFWQEAIIPGHFLLFGNQQDMVLYGKFREAKILPFQK